MQKKIKVKVKVVEKSFKEVKITTDDIRLDAALKLSSAVSTGGQAKMVIQDNMVKVNGDVCTLRGKKLFDGDEFSFYGRFYKIVKE